jgi:glucuronate isomerase
MSTELRRRIFGQLDSLTLIDPHTHINPLDPAAKSLADILGYHYYTELAHSAGLAKDQIEEPGLDPREKVRRLIENLGPLDNTIQHSWLAEMAQSFFGHQGEINAFNWESLYDSAERAMSRPDWAKEVLAKSKLEAVFLTNDFDDPLEGFDTSVYIPCLRTDDLVFHLAKPEVRQRLERCTGIAASDGRALKRAIAALFQHFKSRGARACAISLPPDFSPAKVSPARANTALAAINADGIGAAESHRRAIGNFVFWTLAEMADAFKLPLDLMIGVNRGVYEAGVHQGRDLYDSRCSLIQYKELFNAFPRVTFPISVLASVTNQELTSYAWIFPNVVTNGHWWYSNTPAFIEHDLAARLEAVPRTKQIGYYSDMYKLEFALPKFAMYKRILAKVLAERFVIDRGWSEEAAVRLGTQVLRSNVETIFRWGEDLREEIPSDSQLDSVPASESGGGMRTAADFAAPVSGVAAAALAGAASTDIESPLYQPPPEQGVLGLDFASPLPSEPLREPDEEIVVPVPTEMEAATSEPVELELPPEPADEGELDLFEENRDRTSASAAGIGRAEPPSLEIVEPEATPLDLDFAEQAEEIVPVEPEPAIEPEPVAEEDLIVEPIEDDQAGRMTEPFPFKPKDNPAKPSQDQWGFLGGK